MKRNAIWLLALCTALMMTACGRDNGKDPGSKSQSGAATEYPVSIGESVRLAEKPAKVVSLSPTATELIFTLGYQDQLVGVSDFCDRPEEAANLTRCGTAQGINFEALEGIKPQLLVTTASLIESELVRLQQMDVEVLTLPRASDFKELKNNYVDLARAMNGDITGREQGEELYDSFEGFLTEMENRGKASIQAGTPKQTVIMLRIADYIMATGDTFEQKLLERLMLENLAAPYGDWVFPKDKAAELAPDYIISDSAITIPVLEKNALYKKTQAVLKDKVVTVDFSAFERQTPRMKDELIKIMDMIYPAAQGASGSQSES